MTSEMHEANCRRDLEKDGRVEVYLPRRRLPVSIPVSWVSFRKRSIPPKYRHRKNKFPLVLKMPTELAKQCGVIE